MLDQIIQQKKEEIKSIVLPETCQIERRSFKKALLNPNRFIGLIAEVKKASPSKGLIKEHFVPETIAADYEAAKADALSVLTDTRFFQGRNQFLTDIKQTVSLPVLRKDFIIDSLQVEESFRIGADAILLIGEALEPSELHELYLEAREKGMDVLVEVHDETVLERILQVFQPDILGINNRDLKTFRTSVSQTEKIAQLVPDGCLLVSESGIGSLADLQFVNKHGAQAVLAGESLMREDSQQKAIRGLFGE
ncbi:indole-3-glycerol phosphate synthase TrpC [Bacillus velezensis]|uniref:indole-3-glycerol phosphate synthase TrpC n=1 Tax=Bacillus amyloliquefaciens group TaxID=1938374 RepID=UPI0003970DFA|nr:MULTISPECIES: indole-3-glycerol phosphate synthase TrpC [Bacillus amyloliquefaciens group]AWQ13774.1 indole-3-glycerol phosphate synthase TrpC [Bacillus velezensis]ERH55429.1 indole-3-glycerol phosphate synthase [Bacillus amyloliquefaciens EGD-AQ14]MCC8312669.1 indole-3-glycerol phosphate synthase TrpC [Bacillus velezensis]MDH3122774.1 indole-3-glycerol phosphate synthase TrpC [Bacillus velezensis]MDL0425802.1 indole-3-glycerol phosphate synthase TrpC [Bacillus amyloliquefaciens]